MKLGDLSERLILGMVLNLLLECSRRMGAFYFFRPLVVSPSLHARIETTGQRYSADSARASLSSCRSVTISTVDRFEGDDMDEIAFHNTVGGLARLGQFDDMHTVGSEQGHLWMANFVSHSVRQMNTEGLKRMPPKRFSQFDKSHRRLLHSKCIRRLRLVKTCALMNTEPGKSCFGGENRPGVSF